MSRPVVQDDVEDVILELHTSLPSKNKDFQFEPPSSTNVGFSKIADCRALASSGATLKEVDVPLATTFPSSPAIASGLEQEGDTLGPTRSAVYKFANGGQFQFIEVLSDFDDEKPLECVSLIVAPRVSANSSIYASIFLYGHFGAHSITCGMVFPTIMEQQVLIPYSSLAEFMSLRYLAYTRAVLESDQYVSLGVLPLYERQMSYGSVDYTRSPFAHSMCAPERGIDLAITLSQSSRAQLVRCSMKLRLLCLHDNTLHPYDMRLTTTLSGAKTTRSSEVPRKKHLEAVPVAEYVEWGIHCQEAVSAMKTRANMSLPTPASVPSSNTSGHSFKDDVPLVTDMQVFHTGVPIHPSPSHVQGSVSVEDSSEKNCTLRSVCMCITADESHIDSSKSIYFQKCGPEGICALSHFGH